MSAYWLFAAAAFIISVLANGWLIRLARRKNWFIPDIRPRDVHVVPTPRIGGVGLTIAFMITVGLVLIFSPSSLNFSGLTWLGIDRNLVGLLLALLVLGAVNIVDDYKGLNWPVKLISQIVAALIISVFGILIPTISNPFGDQLIIGNFSWMLVVVWLVVITNVINWLDSIDGVAGGVSTISLIILFCLSISVAVSQPANAMLAIIAAGATLGFLIFNWRGQVFLGDSGTMFLGFLIGVLAIISGGKVATTFLVLAIPFLDALVVFVSRILNHQSPFLPDRRHLIHRLLDRGVKKWQINLLFYALSLIFGLIALNTQTLGKIWAILSAMGVMSFFVLLYSSRKPMINSNNE